jgi:hypothetical protein
MYWKISFALKDGSMKTFFLMGEKTINSLSPSDFSNKISDFYENALHIARIF